jgi:hypothetical protein
MFQSALFCRPKLFVRCRRTQDKTWAGLAFIFALYASCPLVKKPSQGQSPSEFIDRDLIVANILKLATSQEADDSGLQFEIADSSP